MPNNFEPRTNYGERYGRAPLEPTPVIPKWDPLRRDLLPPDYPALAEAAPWTEPTFQHWREEAPGAQVLVFALIAFALTVAGRELGRYVVNESYYPFWLIAAVVVPLFLYLSEQDARKALSALFAVPLVFAALLLLGAAPKLALPAALVSTAVVLDAVAGHAVSWFVAQAPTATRAPALDAWRRRFRPGLFEEGRALARAGQPAEAALLEAVSGYILGFSVLVLVGALAFVQVIVKHDALVLLLVLPPVLATVLLFRVPATPATLRAALGQAAESWFRYGQQGEGAPGILQSPAGSRAVRLGVTAAVLFVLAAALTPGQLHPKVLWTLITTPELRWPIVLTTLGGLFLPLVVVLSAAVAVLGRIVVPFAALRATQDEAGRWQHVVSFLEHSASARVRRQLFLGFHATVHYPVFLPLAQLQEHAHLLGSTGTGKTSLGMLPLALQLVGRRDHAENQPSYAGPILVLDLKGTTEPAPLHALRAAAEQAGRPFRFFTNVTGEPTHGFNPLLELRDADLTVQQQGETMRAALNIEHGTGYGPGHFSALSRRYLQRLMRALPHAQSFAELLTGRADLVTLLGRREAKEEEANAQELLTALELLATRPELNASDAWVSAATSAAEEVQRAALITERIRMQRAVRDREVIYFYLYSHAEEALARYIASFALESFYAAVTLYNRQRPPAERLQSYVFVDEFQQVAGRNFENFMVQARSSGVALILANQTRGQLDKTIRHAVANAGYRQFFDFQEPADLSYIADLAGETLEADPTSPERLSWAKRLRASDMSPLSAQRDTSLVRMKTNHDFAQFDGFPFPIRALHPMSLEEARRLDTLPLPRDVTGTMLVADVDTPATPPPGAAPRRAPRDSDLTALFARIIPTGAPVPDHYTVDDGPPEENPP